uniref:Uncharacterized protein n=1 Tax=Palpitomonas bilix TaxID=652834 RepID=A0A7S3GAI2_9EUKA
MSDSMWRGGGDDDEGEKEEEEGEEYLSGTFRPHHHRSVSLDESGEEGKREEGRGERKGEKEEGDGRYDPTPHPPPEGDHAFNIEEDSLDVDRSEEGVVPAHAFFRMRGGQRRVPSTSLLHPSSSTTSTSHFNAGVNSKKRGGNASKRSTSPSSHPSSITVKAGRGGGRGGSKPFTSTSTSTSAPLPQRHRVGKSYDVVLKEMEHLVKAGAASKVRREREVERAKSARSGGGVEGRSGAVYHLSARGGGGSGGGGGGGGG